MIGFTGKLRLSSTKSSENKEITDFSYKNQTLEILRTSNGKFQNDKVFFEKNGCLFLIEGVITNSKELVKKYGVNSWEEAFYCSYVNNGESFFNEFRGSFCGLIYDILANKLTLFVDHLRTKDVYYSLNKDFFYFSTDIKEIIGFKNKEYELDIDAAYLLLTFGATLEERTLFSSIKKLPYGAFLKFDSKGIDIKSYYKIDIDYSNANSIAYNDHIDNIDKLFRKAVDRQFSKDQEYGYNHLVGLSAGRDSRMTAWVSNDLGYNENVLNFSFSESNELDELIPKKIAKDLRNDWLFKSLDNGNCLKYFEEVNSILCGELSLQNALHGYFFLKEVNVSKYGLMHSGQVGDGIINYYGSNQKSKSLIDLPYVQSKKLMHKVIDRNILTLENYKSDEEFVHVNRGIGVTLGAAQYIYQFTETTSPFTDVDLMNYCFTVPYDVRKGLKLYDDWMLQKYPRSTKYSHNGRKIGGKEFTFLGKTTTLSELPEKVFRLLKSRISSNKDKALTGMNPMDKWYNENPILKKKMDVFYQDNISKVVDSVLKQDVITLYEKGNVGDKLQVITLLATLKQYFN